MEVRISVPRPILTLTLIAVALLVWNGVLTVQWPNRQAQADASGGVRPAAQIVDARQDINREQVKQAVLSHREEILRYHLEILERQALATKAPEDIKQLHEARTVLLQIIRDRGQSEKLLLLSLEQLWDAEGTLFATRARPGNVVLPWPVQPLLGLSATFDDKAYEERFGFPHHAIDIPTEQETPIEAPADGVVANVSLNGLGYSYIVLRHKDGLQTIYGHISDSTVKEGDLITQGQIIGHSGGQPGTLGAGLTTTGPHVHFAVRSDGVLVDPMQYLSSSW